MCVEIIYLEGGFPEVEARWGPRRSVVVSGRADKPGRQHRILERSVHRFAIRN